MSSRRFGFLSLAAVGVSIAVAAVAPALLELAVFERAALFKPGWVGEWTFWLLGSVLVLVVPCLLAGAVRAADAGD